MSELEFDLELLNPTLDFTPTSMFRVENALLNLDGAYDDDSDSDSLTTDDSNQDWCHTSTTSNKRTKLATNGQRQLPGPKSRRRLEDMTPEEINRRQRRRERNKAAAARCRQRRLDLTNQLLAETQELEAEGQRLEREIENLRKQRDQLEFVLDAHRPMCHGQEHEPLNMIKPEPLGQVVMMSMNMMQPVAALRPNSLPVVSNLATTSSALSFGSFDLGSTGVTPVTSASGLNVFLGTGADFMSPTTLLGSPITSL